MGLVEIMIEFHAPGANLRGCLQQLHDLADLKFEFRPISRSDYEQFKHEYIFQAIQNVPFGIAFCRRFQIVDYILTMSRDTNEAQRYIEVAKYIKDEDELK